MTKSELEKWSPHFERLEVDPISEIKKYPKRLHVQKAIRTAKKKLKK